MTFPNEIKEQVTEAQNGYCKLCLKSIHSIHHKLHNTASNRKKFPLFVHSVFNAVGLCFDCHKNKSHLFRVTVKEAEMYEENLRGL